MPDLGNCGIYLKPVFRHLQDCIFEIWVSNPKQHFIGLIPGTFNIVQGCRREWLLLPEDLSQLSSKHLSGQNFALQNVDKNSHNKSQFNQTIFNLSKSNIVINSQNYKQTFSACKQIFSL